MKTFKSRIEYIQQLPSNLIMCEIGVFKGDFSKILYHTKPKELHLIDLFDGTTCSGDQDGLNITCTNMAVEYINIKNNFNNDNVFLHKGDANVVLNEFPNQYFDFIYLDADHTYEAVKSNLLIIKHKIKNNGIISGHDYSHVKFPGLVKAVDEFCQENNLRVNTLSLDLLPSFSINMA